jgi:predicted anti-sigma-YlaC factor YlaD
MMMNCQTATQLLSQALDDELDLAERAPLRLHLWMCTHCRAFKGNLQDMRVLAQAFAQLPGSAPSGDEPPPT